MIQLIGLIVAIVASFLLGRSDLTSTGPVGVSGGGPVGIPHPHPRSTPTPVPAATPNTPVAPH
jgi:hypothetical protein